jgi:cell division protein FtsI (penicillin-binding protein 3)
MKGLLPGNPDRRFRRVRGIAILAVVLILWRLVVYQVVDANQLKEDLQAKLSETRTLPAMRGKILDSKGRVLAKTVFEYDVNAAPDIVNPFARFNGTTTVEVSVAQAAGEIATILKIPAKVVLAKITGTSKYSNIMKKVDAERYRKLQALEIPWLFYDSLPRRIYPSGAVAGNLLGFVGVDGSALAGIERTMNSCLTGVDGKESYEKGVDGIKIPASVQTTQAARDGSDVVLSIDSDLQYYAQQVMAKYVRDERADWGSAVVVEVKTGKILAAAEAPTVDPNVFWKAKADDRKSRIFQVTFEPGSTLKTVAAATAVDSGYATPSTKVRAPYRLKVTNQDWIQDSHLHPTENLTLTGVLKESSNTGISLIAGKVPLATRFAYLKRFGLGERTAVNFEGESGGILGNYKTWDALTANNSMFGQGISVTPIQTAFFYQTVANQGLRLPPRLVLGCQGDDSKLVSTAVPQPTRVISKQAARSTVDMLEKVVEQGGIGRTAGVAGYRIAGKSGTAQIKDGDGYGSRYAISFIGMAPANDPQYVLAVTIYKPRTVSNSIGATPPFKAIMEQLLRMYRVPPSTTKSIKIATNW